MTQKRGIEPVKTASLPQLIDDLRSTDTLRREAAVARLRLLGARALPRLIALIRSDTNTAIRAAALSALDGLEDTRAADVALTCLDDDDDVVTVAAIGVLRGWLTGDHGLPALDAVTGLALTRTRSAAVRLAALDALSELPRELVAPVLEQAPAADAIVGPPDGPHVRDIDDPLAVREWIAAHGARAPLSTLHDLVVRCREREKAEPSARLRQEWIVARGTAHAALAQRGSRVALYDLRESFDAAATPLPLDFLTAVTTAGDATCLEPMARAWDAASRETWWRDRLAGAAAEIVARERISARNPALKRVRGRWPEFVK